ncbi:MAG: NADH-quinone oxidoreductase subunit A [Puniceicoccales bacterium]|jgi:NADH-quinone oxidoreductase subunit A|nr:NADH-quinone oxidoreductase subunit A [Puniceicoccales bacterium]
MDNSLQAHFPVLIQVAIGVALPVVILVASHVFGQRARANAVKDSAYECGVLADATAGPHARFAVKFYVTAMLFILFDIELVFLLPCAMVYREFAAADVAGVIPLGVFFGLIVTGLLYEVRKGALAWER